MNSIIVLCLASIALVHAQMAPHVPDAAAPAYTWDSCGTKLDRLLTNKVAVDGNFSAGEKVTITATGQTDLHVPLESGAWEIRVYETGMPKSVATQVGDLMTALKFLDAKNTTFSVSVSFTLPAKQASGDFLANLVATDQAKSDYMCLEIKYSLKSAPTPPTLAMVQAGPAPPHPTPPHPSPTPPPAPAPLCFHMEDTEDHKCFEACSTEGQFTTKGIDQQGACPRQYNTVDTTKTVLQCPDGVTNVRYCAATALNVTIATKGEAGSMALEMLSSVADDSGYVHMIETSPGDHCLEVVFPGGADSPFWKADGWKYSAPVRPEWKTGPCDQKKWTSVDSQEKDYDGWTADKNSPYGSVTLNKYGYDTLVAPMEDQFIEESPEKAPPAPLCFHMEDTEDHKCFEACSTEGQFTTKGIDQQGACPGQYNTVDTTKTVLQCPDGVTNVRYCAATALNVTIATKGEAGAEALATEFQRSAVQDFSVYCMNDPSKQPPYYCHVPPMPTSCVTDKDCVTPWYNSFCMNDDTKKPPFECKLELPPTCKTDKDCQRK